MLFLHYMLEMPWTFPASRLGERRADDNYERFSYFYKNCRFKDRHKK